MECGEDLKAYPQTPFRYACYAGSSVQAPISRSMKIEAPSLVGWGFVFATPDRLVLDRDAGRSSGWRNDHTCR
jgi:hypothetical protein